MAFITLEPGGPRPPTDGEAAEIRGAIGATSSVDVDAQIDARTASGTPVNTRPETASVVIAVLPTEDDTVTIGALIYTFKASPVADGDVLLGIDPAACRANLVDEINAGGTPNTQVVAVDAPHEAADSILLISQLGETTPFLSAGFTSGSNLVVAFAGAVLPTAGLFGWRYVDADYEWTNVSTDAAAPFWAPAAHSAAAEDVAVDEVLFDQDHGKVKRLTVDLVMHAPPGLRAGFVVQMQLDTDSSVLRPAPGVTINGVTTDQPLGLRGDLVSLSHDGSNAYTLLTLPVSGLSEASPDGRAFVAEENYSAMRKRMDMTACDESVFVVMSDWHYAEEFGRGGVQRCRDGYRRIGDHRPSLGISCGDLISMNDGADNPIVDYGMLRQIKILSGCPWLHCLGNHELATDHSGTDEEKQARQRAFYDGVEDFYTENHFEFGQIPFTEDHTTANVIAYHNQTSPVHGADYWAPPFDPQLFPQKGQQPVTISCVAIELPLEQQARTLGYYAMRHYPTGITHIVLNPVFTHVSGKGTFDQAQRDWLENEVFAKLDASDRVCVYCHYRIWGSEGGTTDLEETVTQSRSWIMFMLENCPGKVLACFSGHTHADYRWTVNGINYIGLDDGDSHKSKPYTDTTGDSMCYYLCKWDEATSTFTVDGYGGTVVVHSVKPTGTSGWGGHSYELLIP